MIVNDRVIGFPLTIYTNTRSNINAMVPLQAGAIAYATDTLEFVVWTGATWTEVTGVAGTWSHNETPSGTIDGANTTFTLAHTPASWIQLYLNGIMLEPGAGNDYTLSGSTVTMLFAPATGDKLRTYYMY